MGCAVRLRRRGWPRFAPGFLTLGQALGVLRPAPAWPSTSSSIKRWAAEPIFSPNRSACGSFYERTQVITGHTTEGRCLERHDDSIVIGPVHVHTVLRSRAYTIAILDARWFYLNSPREMYQNLKSLQR